MGEWRGRCVDVWGWCRCEERWGVVVEGIEGWRGGDGESGGGGGGGGRGGSDFVIMGWQVSLYAEP